MLKRHTHLVWNALVCALLLFGVAPALEAQGGPAADFTPPDGLAFRIASVTSEGVRLHAELLSLESLAGQRLPTIIMAHGWGGTAAVFRRDSVVQRVHSTHDRVRLRLVQPLDKGAFDRAERCP